MRQMPRAPRIVPEDRRTPRRRPPGRRPPLPPPRITARVVPPARSEAPRRSRFRVLRYTIIAVIWGVLAAGVMLLWFARDLPRPEAALDAFRRPSQTLEDRGGDRKSVV